MENKKQNNKEKILLSALELFAEKGFEATSISEIAQKAGVAKSLIYHYFKDKNALLNEIFSSFFKSFEFYFQELTKIESPKLRLKKILLLSFDELLNNRKFWELYFFVLMQPNILNMFTSEFEFFYKESINFLTNIFMEMGYKEPRQEAIFFVGALDGLQLHLLTKVLGEEEVVKLKSYLFKKYHLDGGVDEK